jgi:hypothetical protein
VCAIDNEIILFEGDEVSYKLSHSEECCEDVHIEDICGDLSDLENTPIIRASTKTQNGENGYQQWTFYDIVTKKGAVTIRFIGETDSCYSLDVDVYRITKK